MTRQLDKLLHFLEVDNVAAELNEDQQKKIASMVDQDYKLDENSRQSWLMMMKKALDIANQTFSTKSTPWQGASNIKYPLIPVACVYYSAHAYSELIRSGKILEITVNGKDVDGEKSKKARRVTDHMNYQLLVDSDDWESDHDKLQQVKAFIGHAYKKTYYDYTLKKNISELCIPDKVVVNNNIKSLESARRITHIVGLYKNEIIERINCGKFLDVDVDKLFVNDSGGDSDPVHELLEQHRFLDLDDDGYEEPYVVVVHKDTSILLGIYPRFDHDSFVFNTDDDKVLERIVPIQFFTDYIFLPAFDGTYHGIGFGRLLYSMNDSVNTIINQIVDSGTLYNTQFGFIGKGLRLRDPVVKAQMGVFTQVDVGGEDVAKNIYQFPTKEPSQVLLALLGTLLDAAKELSNVSDIMTGQQDGQNVPAITALTLAEKGLKVYGSIQKRDFRSLKKEFKKWFTLNRKYLSQDEYAMFGDTPEFDVKVDYDELSLDIKPCADPYLSSDAQRLARAQGVYQTIPLLQGPGQQAALQTYYDALNIPESEQQAYFQANPNPPPDPKLVKVQGDLQVDLAHLELEKIDRQLAMKRASLDELEFKLKAMLGAAKVEGIKAEAIKDLHQANMSEKELKVKEKDIDLNYEVKKDAAKAKDSGRSGV